ncbi:hypothetical protein VE01_04507 [Pseudogymnoascus verrucosus]|uniref:Uncharacterized protein n=1 Tax=Pseudogymnoascus verrucosus TaxID=342668 RepID=A0A1B8GNY6_9PEZI|nr:uncharacterized protein VE01_04507 [Pseudogymnoascus verrucosus]OBT97547.1 hypothetical protein VE01_04507 [Pseudogymnoascus verrucosus]
MAELAGTAVGAISLGIQVCQGLVEYYGSWKDAPKDVARMCQSIRSLEERLNAVNAVVKNNGIASQAGSGVQSGIDSCVTSIAELQSQLIKVQEISGPNIWSKVHGHGRRLLYPFRESTLLKLNGIVSEMRENLSFALDVLQLQSTESSTEQLEYVSTQVDSLSTFILSRHDDQESIAIVNWLSPLNFFVAQNDILRRRQIGTGEWLFETLEFEAWLAGRDRILWCSGQPGAGKTVLASSIINKLQIRQSSRDVGLAFTYCNYKEHDIQTLSNLMGSLVQQLVQCYGAIPDEVRVLYTQYNARNIRPSEDELSRALLSLISKFSHVYIVVDALDECNPKTRGKFIEKLQQLPTNLRLLCSSRHLGDIQEAFADASHLEIRASDADVALYRHRSCKYLNWSSSDTIVDKLVMKAKGMFLLAELHLESLKTKTDIKSLRKALDVLPDKLEKTYDDALERIQRQPEDESKLAMRVLSWITHAVRPLKVEEIQHAIAVMNFDSDDTTLDEEGLPDEAELITVCGGSAVIDQDSGVIRLVHYTTQDYFERHRSRIFPTAQADILCACIRYLSLESFKNGPCETNSDLRKRQAKFRLLGYASCNWANHVCGELDDTVEERAIQFLNNKSLLSNATLIRLLEFPENLSTLSSSIQTWWVSAHLHSVFWSDMIRTEIPGITIAAEFGLTSLIDKMLKQGNSINEGGIQGKAALHEAARNGHMATVELLLERGADTEAKDVNGRTALLWAVQAGYESILRLLLNKGANIDAKGHNGMTALLWAAESGLEAIVQLLVENGADMEATSLYGYTPLLFAGSKGYVSMVQLLLQNGANIEVTDKYGNPLLFVAARNGNKAVVRLLLEKWFAMKDQGRDAVL